jgi:hypothetical protein
VRVLFRGPGRLVRHARGVTLVVPFAPRIAPLLN